jgi:UDP-2-acetamido-3-amino-2,3-dideoxy-glucuronate N-acetyltransferase
LCIHLHEETDAFSRVITNHPSFSFIRLGIIASVDMLSATVEWIEGKLPVAKNVNLGRDVSISYPELVNLYGCSIGAQTKIGPFVEIQKNVEIGARCKICSHTFICEGVSIENECFIGHHVCFVNDRYPRATSANGQLQTETDWQVIPTRVCKGASIGSGALIMCGVTIGAGALVGAGAVVTHDVAPRQTVAGVPARLLRSRYEHE